MDPIRVLLADDHAVLRAGLKLLLEAQPDIQVVGEAASGEEAVHCAAELNPDVVLLDLAMPGCGGLACLPRLREACPGARVLVLTMHDDEGYLRQVLKAGGAGYVLKRAADTELIYAIRTVAKGDMYVYPSLTRVLVEGLVKEQPLEDEARGETLSRREIEVLRLIALGYTNHQIAEKLVLSVKTVETHKSRIMDKLGMRRRSELVRYAISRGLIST